MHSHRISIQVWSLDEEDSFRLEKKESVRRKKRRK
jgi:hypothetical protein